MGACPSRRERARVSQIPHVDPLPASIRLLLIVSDPAVAARVRQHLSESRACLFEVLETTSLKEGLQQLEQDAAVEVVLLDLRAADAAGLDALASARAVSQEVPIVVLTGEEDEAQAVRALRLGAHDYLIDAASDSRLVIRTLRHAVERQRMLRDLSLARQREFYLATHDGLTGLANRWAFHDQLRRALASASRNRSYLAVMVLDLDRFKAINDTLSHAFGDELLKAVAERLTAVVRESDLVARAGGDEFVVMLPDLRRDYDPAKVADHLLEALARPYRLGEREYWITTTIGVVVYPRDGADADTLLRNADAALFHAKSQGPNRYRFYADGMNAAALERLEIETGLREALERNEIFVHYQPQIDVESGEVFGVEALVRWRHPRRGVVSPAAFIPVAEETGVINAVGEWVLRTACADAARWIAAGASNLRLAVNVSSRQLGHKGFASVVSRALRESGLEPERLELEITESSVMRERGVTLAALLVARKLGVRVAIDDFGTGYSSLTALKRLPVDVIKIDRSFVRGVVSEAADATITRALVRMGQGLGLEVIAEGVETEAQRDTLRGFGCRLMQGYLFDRPMEAAELERKLLEGEARWRGVRSDPDA